MTVTLVPHTVDDLHTCAALRGWPSYLCHTLWMTFTLVLHCVNDLHTCAALNTCPSQPALHHSFKFISFHKLFVDIPEKTRFTITLNVYHFDNLNFFGNYIHNIEEFLWTTGIHVFSNSWSLCTWVLWKIAIVVSSRNRPCWNLNVVITSTHLIMKSPQYTHSEATMSSSSACRWRKENWYSIRYTVIQ